MEDLLRPCKVKGKDKEEKGWFHGWEHWSNVVGESAMIGGHSAGQISQVFGLVEFEDGTVKRIQPYDIVFDRGVLGR